MYEPMSLNLSAVKRRVRYVEMEGGPYSINDVQQAESFENRRCRSANSSFRKKYKPKSPIPIEERPRWRYWNLLHHPYRYTVMPHTLAEPTLYDK